MPNMTSPGTGSLNMLQRIEALENENKQLKDANEFSFEERRIGTWIDGKPLYRKMVDFGALPSNGRKNFEHRIPNIEHSHINIGESFWYPSGSFLRPCDAFINLDYIKSVGCGTGVIVIFTNNSSANNYSAIMCIEYTKTTD